MKKIVAISFLTAVVFAAACGGSDSKTQPSGDSQPGAKADGSAIYTANCAFCHGADGKLGSSGAADLSVSKIDRATSIVQITDGKGLMVGFKGRLSDTEIAAVADYIVTLRK